MIYCIQCGSKLEEGAVFCTACGKNVGQINNQQGPVMQPNYVQQGYNQPVYVTPMYNRGAGYNIDTKGLMIWSCISLIFVWPLAIYCITAINSINHAATEEEGRRRYKRINLICLVNTIIGVLIYLFIFFAILLDSRIFWLGN